MRIAVICNDTRGGVQPYVALARGLKTAGHDVWGVAPADFVTMFEQNGVAAAGLAGEAEAMLAGSAGIAEQGSLQSMRHVTKALPELLGRWTAQTLEACEGADVLTGGVGGMIVGLSVADRLGRPFIPTHLQPIGVRSGDYPGVMLSGLPGWLGPVGRRASHVLSDAAIWMPFKPAMSMVRSRTLGLHGRSNAANGQPVLYGISPRVVEIASDRHTRRIATGYWTLAAAPDWSPPKELAAFVARPGPVVSIGFGSMTAADPAELGDIVAAAVEKAGVRAVILSGWDSLRMRNQDGRFHVAYEVPHDWLFPRMAAVVHHGGAGTSAAAFRAGVPAIVVPFTMDQPFWARRTHSLGVGPRPIARQELTPDRLARAIALALRDQAMIDRASLLGLQLRAKDGVSAAVREFARLGR